ncbi:MAG: indolepyruvate oxidoreductase subunit beta [Oscillospiraceae bacterium]|nr:indolepyruvate oxidoreductase subunit beta [Oscillospiraceae bacterium]
MSDVTGVVIAGVGGQGIILASRLLAETAMDIGLDVKVSEVHGMSQRGGSVITYVRYGRKVYAPLVEVAEADYLISFECLETARWLSMLKDGGTIVMNSQQIAPSTVLANQAVYPSDISARLNEITDISVFEIDALRIAKDSGFIRAANVALMGAFAAVSNLPYESLEKSLERILEGRRLEENMFCFRKGYESVRK